MADLESIVGNAYNQKAHDGVDKLYFLGGEDPKNPLPMEDGLQKDEWNYQEVYDAARVVYGPRIVEDRFPRCHLAYQKAGVDAQFRLYPEMTHNPTPASHDLREFYRKSIEGEDISKFGQRFELPLDRKPQAVQTSTTIDQVEVEFSPTGKYPPPEGLVSYTWALGDGTTKTGMQVTHTYGEAGTYEVRLSMETAHGQEAETTAEFTFEAPSFELVEYELSAEELQVGESVTVTATVSNPGTRSDNIPVEFSVDGQVVETKSPYLNVNETEDLTFEHTFENTGEFELTISNASVGTVVVRPEATSTPTSSPTPTSTQTPSSTETSAETPGFGVLAALAGIGSAVGYRLLRDDTEGG